MHMAGRYTEARPLFDDWLKLVRAQPPLFTPERAEQLGTMATIMQFTRQTERADTLQREVLKIDRALYGNAHHRVAADLSTLGSLELDVGDMASADTLLRQAVAILRTSYPEGHPQLPHTLRDLGYLLVEREQWQQADTVWRETAALSLKFTGRASLDYVNALSFVALCATMRGRTAEAERLLRIVLASDVARRPDPNPVASRARLFLGRVLLDEGRVTEAEPLLLAATGPKARTLSRATHRLAIRSLVDLYRAEGRPLDAARYAAAQRR
jgi:tetratricopeptide (TPR) repeat protein